MTTEGTLHVLILGMAGAGKSSLINSLARLSNTPGATVATSASRDVATKKFHPVHLTFENQEITFIDTPGFLGSRDTAPSNIDGLLKRQFEGRTSDCIIYVTTVFGRWSPEEWSILRAAKSEVDGPYPRLLIVITNSTHCPVEYETPEAFHEVLRQRINENVGVSPSSVFFVDNHPRSKDPAVQ